MTDRNHQPGIDVVECAAELLRNVRIPAGPPPQLMASTVEALQTADRSPDAVRPRDKRISMIRIARYSGTAVAAMLAIVAGAMWIVGHNASVTWAQVVDNVNKARTVSFVVKQKSSSQPEIEARLSLRGSVLRYEIADAMVMIMDTDSRKGLELDVGRKIARKVDFAGRAPAEDLKDPIDTLRRLGDGPKDNVESLGDEELDGMKCHVYQVKGAQALLIGNKFKLWVAATSGLPVRIQAGDDKTSLAYEKFRWNEPLDEERFRLAVPAGYRLEELAPAVIHPGRIYYSQGSAVLSSVQPDGQKPEVQFVPRGGDGPGTYNSDKSELSADGRYLVIGYSNVNDKGAFPPNRLLLWDRVLPSDPASEVYIRPNGEVQWSQFSPDGRRLYVSYWEQVPGQEGSPGRYGADVVDLRTKTTQPLKLPLFKNADGVEREMFFAAASADGKQFLVVGDGLHLATSEGELVRRLTRGDETIDPRSVRLSPDGLQVVCVSVVSQRGQQLCVVSLADGKLTELTPAATITDLRARWSPDGKRIAFTCRSFAPNNPPFHKGTETYLKLVSVDGSNVVTLVTEKVHPEATSLELTAWR